MQNRSQVARPSLALAILSGAAFMAALDVFIVNVAFPDIGADYHGASLGDLSWILNAYAIVYAALLVPLGRLADRIGRRAGFAGGLAVFTAASAACALSPGLWWLVGFRVAQAVGAAALTPASLGLLLTSTPPARRVRAVRIWAAVGALAASVGPVAGGLLVEASWRFVFLVNVPIGLGLIVAALRLLGDSRDESVTRLPDLAGAAVLAVAIGALALALVEGEGWGWASAPTLASVAVAGAGVALFWARSLRHPLPLVEPGLLRVPAFAWANVTMLSFSIAFGASILGMILWLQDVWGYSALRTGLAIAPGAVMVPLFVAFNQRVAGRVRPGRLAAAGNLLFGGGTLLLILCAGKTPHYLSEVLPGWLLIGLGVGLTLPTVLSSATADLPAARAATGSAIVNMTRQIGLVLGISVLVAVVGSHAGFAAERTAYRHGWAIVVAACAVAAVTALGMTPRGAGEPVTAPPVRRALLAFAGRR